MLFLIILDVNGYLEEVKLDKIFLKDKKMFYFELNNILVFFCLLIKVMFEVMIKMVVSIIGGYFRLKEIYGYGLKYLLEKFVFIIFVWNLF